MLRLILNLKCGDPMSPAIQIEQQRILIVEGKDAVNFFTVMINDCDRSNIQVLDFGGITDISRFLSALVITPSWDQVISLGIVRDAEKNAQSAIESVRQIVNNNGLSLDSDSPRISIFILPDNEHSGMLETLLCKSFEADEINDCIEEFFTCCSDRANVEVKRMEKARAHAYLATREDPHVSVGVAAQKGYWNLNHQAFEQLREFIGKL